MKFFNFGNKEKDKVKKSMTLKEITKLLDGLYLSLLNITPINLEKEKKKFFASKDYNPHFKYEDRTRDNEEIFNKLLEVEEISDVDPRISDFYIKLIADKKQTHDMMKASGDNEIFTSLAWDKYGKISDNLLHNASIVIRGNYKDYNVVIKDNYKKKDYLDFNKIVDIFHTVFEELGMEDWQAVASENISKNGVKTGVKAKKIYLDKNIKKRPFALRKTIVHEVGTHVLRAVNGKKTGFEALAKPNLAEYLDIEEGLAFYNEEMVGVLKDWDLRKRAIYVWAIHLGENLSFRQLYDAVHALVTKSNAFNIVYRVKRGLGDTSQPGIYPKDAAYFRGFRKVRWHLRKKPYLYKLLYAGKISLDKVEWVEEGLLPKPKIVPSKDMFSKIFKECKI